MNRIAIILLSTAVLMTSVSYNAVAKSKGRSERVAIINDASYYLHTVEKGDTIYSLSKLYDTEQATILSANPTLGAVMQLGSEIRIPLKRGATKHNKQRGAGELIEEPLEDSLQTEPRVQRAIFTPLAEGDTLSIALLLPLSVNGRTGRPFVEFYQGVLLAVEDLKMSGRSVKVNLYNTERNITKMQTILSDESYQSSQLIVGPVYEELLDVVLRDAESRATPVVSPLVTISKSDSPVLFQMAPDLRRRYDKMDDLLGEDRTVTLIEGESNDKSFREEIEKLLTAREIEYFTHEYKYEHTSSVEDRERAAEKLIKEAREAAEALGELLDEAVIDSLSAEVSKGDLTPLLKAEEIKTQRLIYERAHADSLDLQPVIAQEQSSDKVDELTDDAEPEEEEEIDLITIPINHTLFILSNNEVEVDRILSALSSARAALITTNRGSGRDIRSLIKYKVVANPDWRRYKNIDRSVYFRNNVVLFSSYLAGRDAEIIRHFDSRYAEAFSELPSLYAYRGFDIVSIFGEGMYNDIEFNMSGEVYSALQSGYRFEVDETRELIVNTNWMRESYNPNFTKDIE